jgi:hypothetical protein
MTFHSLSGRRSLVLDRCSMIAVTIGDRFVVDRFLERDKRHNLADGEWK